MGGLPDEQQYRHRVRDDMHMRYTERRRNRDNDFIEQQMMNGINRSDKPFQLC
jgi:hypothetical protein